MERNRRKMNVASMSMATHLSLKRIESTLNLAEKFTHDPERENRLEACLCKSCFYVSRIGGAAMTQEPCMCCGKMQTYGSTDTDALCLLCAQENALCKHCGADMELRKHRKTWPVPNVADILVNEQLRKALSRANGQQDEKEDCDNV